MMETNGKGACQEAACREAILRHVEALAKEVEAAGEQLRGKPLPQIREEEFGLYEKTGDRLTFERVYFARRKALATAGLLAIWHKRQADLDWLVQVITEICQEKCWALPAHVDRSTEGWERTVDLFGCETGQALAEITTLLSPLLPEKVKAMVKREVDWRLLDSYLSVPKGEWNWEGFYNNWCAVCAGCLGSMAIYLMGDEPGRQQACLDRVCSTMEDYLEGFKEDGTCPEGLSYFVYGMSYFTGFADQLSQFTGGRVDLMKNPKVGRIARFQQRCFLNGGLTVSFSDGQQRDRYRLGLTCYLAMKVPGVSIPDIGCAMHYGDDSCYRWMADYRDHVWSREFLNRGLPKEAGKDQDWFFVLPDAQWAIGNSQAGTSMAMKGGNNLEPHNHNDIGSFLFAAHGEMFLVDLGCGEYTKDYFHEKRYSILCNRSLGHSVPLINGMEQREGEEYLADSFAYGTEGQVEVSFAGAYEKGLVKSLDRRLVFDKKSGSLSIQDVFTPSSRTIRLTENLVAMCQPQVSGQVVALKGIHAQVKVTVLEPEVKIFLRKERFMNHFGQPEDVWLIQWDLPMAGHQVFCHMVVEVG